MKKRENGCVNPVLGKVRIGSAVRPRPAQRPALLTAAARAESLLAVLLSHGQQSLLAVLTAQSLLHPRLPAKGTKW
jgi:hypothetical protein